MLAKRQQYKAFTLAEVLITLMVIGILAVITIPSILQSWEEQVTVSKLKKTYSALQQAFKLAENENGPIESSYSSIEEYAQALTKYLPVVKDCGIQPSGCASDYKRLNAYEGQENYKVENTSTYKVILKDGVGVYTWFSPKCTNVSYGNEEYKNKFCNLLYVDVNASTPPNVIGKDMFFFCNTTEGIIPVGGAASSYCFGAHNNTCRTTQNGFACARWVIERGNMDYLRQITNW